MRLSGLLEGGVEAQLGLYTEYLTRTQELSLLLEDARALQAQYRASGEADLSVGLPADVRARYEEELAAARGALARAEGRRELPTTTRWSSRSPIQHLSPPPTRR